LSVDGEYGRLLASALAFYGTAWLSPLGWGSNLIALVPLICFLMSLRAASIKRSISTLIAVAFLVMAIVALLQYDVIGARLFHALLSARHYGLAGLTLACAACAVAVEAADLRTHQQSGAAR
jgi:hypothetical protein